jgi:hypothetical protein
MILTKMYMNILMTHLDRMKSEKKTLKQKFELQIVLLLCYVSDFS